MSSLWLNERRKNITSQNGEDGVIAAIFERIGTTNQWCCELGANDGMTFSNTYSLIQKGWHGVLIESNPKYFAALERNLIAELENGRVHAVAEHVTKSGDTSLDSILHNCLAPPWLDLLSLDTDGGDYDIWESLSDEHRPRVVIIEVDSRIPPGKLIEGTWEGACIEAVVRLGKEKGYELALHMGNCVFVSREYCQDLGVEPKKWPELFDRSWMNEPSKVG